MWVYFAWRFVLQGRPATGKGGDLGTVWCGERHGLNKRDLKQESLCTHYVPCQKGLSFLFLCQSPAMPTGNSGKGLKILRFLQQVGSIKNNSPLAEKDRLQKIPRVPAGYEEWIAAGRRDLERPPGSPNWDPVDMGTLVPLWTSLESWH